MQGNAANDLHTHWMARHHSYYSSSVSSIQLRLSFPRFFVCSQHACVRVFSIVLSRSYAFYHFQLEKSTDRRRGVINMLGIQCDQGYNREHFRIFFIEILNLSFGNFILLSFSKPFSCYLSLFFSFLFLIFLIFSHCLFASLPLALPHSHCSVHSTRRSLDNSNS